MDRPFVSDAMRFFSEETEWSAWSKWYCNKSSPFDAFVKCPGWNTRLSLSQKLSRLGGLAKRQKTYKLTNEMSLIVAKLKSAVNLVKTDFLTLLGLGLMVYRSTLDTLQESFEPIISTKLRNFLKHRVKLFLAAINQFILI